MAGFFSIDKKEAVKGAKFFLLVLGIYSALFALAFFLPVEFFEFLVAKAVLLFSGIKGEAILQEPVLIEFAEFTVAIDFLCSGLMELFLLTAAVLATPLINARKKIIGVAGAFAATLAFNVLRITATIHAIAAGDLAEATFTHDVLFRVSLLLVIVGFYWVWFYWATGKLKFNRNA